MYESSVKVRVRYGETDQMGYVYYGNYAMYYEVARVESLRKLGFAYKKLEEEEGIMLPVLENHSRFLFPGKYDELLEIRVIIPKLPGVKIVFHYEVRNEEEKLINTGETILAFVDKTTMKPCRPPQKMLDLLAPYFYQE